ncbi:hypothetical protein JCM6882_002915 [Rhodosporidiobolus microsporus]
MLSLPAELLELIISPSLLTPLDFVSLALVSRNLLQLARRRLYSNIHIWILTEEIEQTWSILYPSTEAIRKTLVEHPHLRPLVRNVRFEYAMLEEGAFEGYQTRALRRHLFPHRSDAVELLHLFWRDVWSSDKTVIPILRSKSVEPLDVLDKLLASLPSLEELQVDESCAELPPLVLTSVLPHVHTLTLTRYPPTLDSFPSLRTLRFWQADNPVEPFDLQHLRPPRHLSRLHLDHLVLDHYIRSAAQFLDWIFAHNATTLTTLNISLLHLSSVRLSPAVVFPNVYTLTLTAPSTYSFSPRTEDVSLSVTFPSVQGLSLIPPHLAQRGPRPPGQSLATSILSSVPSTVRSLFIPYCSFPPSVLLDFLSSPSASNLLSLVLVPPAPREGEIDPWEEATAGEDGVPEWPAGEWGELKSRFEARGVKVRLGTRWERCGSI